MIKALIDTTFAGRFGASAQRAPIKSDTVRLAVSANGVEIIVWDMTEQQAENLYGHLGRTLGYNAESVPRSYQTEKCAYEGPGPGGPLQCGVVRAEHVGLHHQFKSPNAG